MAWEDVYLPLVWVWIVPLEENMFYLSFYTQYAVIRLMQLLEESYLRARWTLGLTSSFNLAPWPLHSWCDGSSDRSFMVDPLSYFSFQPVLPGWCNKGRGMCYPFCGMMHIKQPLLLIGKINPCFLSPYLNGPLPYVWRHIIVNKMCRVRR